MMRLGGGRDNKNKKKKKKRPRPPVSPPPPPSSSGTQKVSLSIQATTATAAPPPPSHQQQQQHHHAAARQQLQQQKRKKAKKEEEASMGLGAWVMLPGVERDIFVDRCRKEVALLLGIPPSDDNKMEEEPDTKSQQPGKRKEEKLRVKVFTAKEASPSQKYARSQLCIGINEVARALEKGHLAFLFICRDVKPPRLVEHLAVTAALHSVPFFILPKATAALGQAFGIQRIAALGFCHGGGGGGGGEGNEEREEVEGHVKARLDSFYAFILGKKDWINGAAVAAEVVLEEEEEEEGKSD